MLLGTKVQDFGRFEKKKKKRKKEKKKEKIIAKLIEDECNVSIALSAFRDKILLSVENEFNVPIALSAFK